MSEGTFTVQGLFLSCFIVVNPITCTEVYGAGKFHRVGFACYVTNVDGTTDGENYDDDEDDNGECDAEAFPHAA